MCGIAGYLHKGTVSQPKHVLNAMLTRIGHRGPDECGLYLSPEACIGNVRLSIVDVETGQQPMCTSDGRYWISYNGEMYNHPELRSMLQKKGHHFYTLCDTEVVLHMYQEFGTACLSQFNGQFSMAIWDSYKKELFLARDRFGIRPLFYTQTENSFVFASEIKALFEYPDVQRTLNSTGIAQVFTFWSTLASQTAFENIFELAAGNYAIVRNGIINTTPYYNLSFDNIQQITLSDAIDKFENLFQDSLALRMRADVPVAAYLSGGIDSTSTTAFIKKMFPDKLKTFSIGFEQKEYDESNFQTEVANYLETQHHSISFKNKDVVDLFEKVIWHTEVPVLRTAPFPMYKLSELVKSHNIKVVITGEGADEILGGYNIFKETIIRQFWAKYPQSKIRPLLLKRLYPYLPQINEGGVGMLKLFFGYKLSDTDSPVYSHLLRWKNTSRISNFFSDEFKEQMGHVNLVEDYAKRISSSVSGFTSLAKAQYIESDIFMKGYLLSSQGDRVSMANSVEGRYPFLDHRLVEFCSTLPDQLKISGLDEKYLLKKVVKNSIPASVLKRPKQAYRAPVSQALLYDKTGFVDEHLSPHKIKNAGFFDIKSVDKLMHKLKLGNGNNEVENMALMGILSTQVLNEIYVQNYRHLHKDEIKQGRVMNETQHEYRT